MKKNMKAEQVKEEKARPDRFVGKKKVWCSGWGKVPDPCSFVEVNPTTRFKKLPRENQLERRRRRKKEAEMYTKFYYMLYFKVHICS